MMFQEGLHENNRRLAGTSRNLSLCFELCSNAMVVIGR